MGKIKNTWLLINSLELKTIVALKQTMIFLIVANLFGLYWYLGLKSIATSLLIVQMSIFVFLIISEKNQKEVKKVSKEKLKEEKEPEEKPEEEKEEGEVFGNMDLGLPSAEEYEKRVNKALGF